MVDRRWWGRAFGAALLVVSVATPAINIDELTDLLDELDDLEREQEQLEQQDEVLDDSEERRSDRVDDAEGSLQQRDYDWHEARREAARAEADVAAAEMRVEHMRREKDDALKRRDRVQRDLSEREDAVEEAVFTAYVYGANAQLRVIDAALGESSLADAGSALDRLGAVGTRELENVDRLARLQDELVAAEQEATAAAERLHDAEEEATALAQEAAELERQAQAARDEAEQSLVSQQRLATVVSQERDHTSELLEDTGEALEDTEASVDDMIGDIGQAGGIICPVPTGSFIDDWHFPRPNDRLHKGNDIFADTGDPIFATEGGTVRNVNRTDRWRPGSQTGLGGRTVSIETEPGTWWYYAHLDEVAEGLSVGDRVEPGEIIGTVGTSGNARHTPPHLHIEYRPGGSPTNPYPLIDPACR